MTPEELAELRTTVFTVESPCGRSWEVPLRCVLNDYVQYRKDADGDSRKKVMGEISLSDIQVWFYEQYSWSDVERDGRLVASPNQDQINAALDVVRGGAEVGSSATYVQSPHLVSRAKRKALVKHAVSSINQKGSFVPKL